MTDKEKKEIIELVHKTLRGFFEPFPEGELGARPFTQTEKVLLEVNKVLCEKIKETPTVELHGEWTNEGCCTYCGENKFKGLVADVWADWQPNFCPNCGTKMMKEGDKSGDRSERAY